MQFDSLGISSVNEPQVGCSAAGLHFWNSTCFRKEEKEKKREKEETWEKTPDISKNKNSGLAFRLPFVKRTLQVLATTGMTSAQAVSKMPKV